MSNVCVKNNTHAVPAHHAMCYQYLSLLTGVSSLYGYSRQHPYAWVPLCVGCSTYMYWKHNDFSIWRYIDIATVQLCMWFQVAYAAQFTTRNYLYITYAVGVLCFILSQWCKYQLQMHRCAFILHALVHIIANAGNVLMYSGERT